MTTGSRPVVVPAVTARPAGAVGDPAGVNDRQKRSDFRPDDFVAAIEAHGERVAWSRAVDCPCEPVDPQTTQSDPTCTLCQGSGWLYFGAGVNDWSRVGTLTDAQQAVITQNNAYVIRALMTSFGKQESPWDRIGAVRMGTTNVTTRAENRLGYYDKIVSLDSRITFQEVVPAPQPSKPLCSRYVIDGGVNLCRSVDTGYQAGVDFDVRQGRLYFRDGRGPQAGTRLAMHYYTFPTWLVIEWPHVVRGTYLPGKDGIAATPAGGRVDLPTAAVAKLEFLLGHTPKVAVDAASPPSFEGLR